MAKLGSPKTRKTNIGTAELRIGPLNMANKLTQAHSIGLVDSTVLEVAQESVDLMGGFPQTLVDTAIVNQTAQITATLREFSRRNIAILLGQGASSGYTEEVATTLASPTATGGTSVAVTDATGLAAGDLVVIYPTGKPEELSVVRVESITTNTLTLDTNTPVLQDYAAGARLYRAQAIPVGAVQEAQYFAVQLIQRENSTGKPIGFSFWKGTIASGMNLATNPTDFASTDLVIKLLQPAESEYGASQPLAHLADIIPDNPVGIAYFGGDV